MQLKPYNELYHLVETGFPAILAILCGCVSENTLSKSAACSEISVRLQPPWPYTSMIKLIKLKPNSHVNLE